MKVFLLLLVLDLICVDAFFPPVDLRNPSRTLDPAFCQRLFAADSNKFKYRTDYDITLQNRTSMRKRNDVAPLPLFLRVNEHKLNRSTYARMEDLFDNYELYTGRTENISRNKVKENWRFINAVMKTGPMKLAHRYLAKELLAAKSKKTFKKMLMKMWFHFYKRKVSRDSSGFEHVFVGEIATKRRRRKSVGGFHNWVRFYREERAGSVDYEGYIKVTKTEPRILTIRFRLDSVEKPIGGFFIGTSPEFELALYTTCFLKFPNGNCKCRMNGKNILIKTYRLKNSKNHVATVYPVA